MGTDIHMYVEKRVGGKWVTADKWSKDKYAESENAPLTVAYGDHIYSDRNYDMFAILAGVRNGSGFAGVDTGNGFVPIVAPRGLPEDMNPELTAYIEEHGIDHTPSWLTVEEIMAYDWTRTTKKRGWVNAAEWSRWRDYGRPESWSGGISGGAVRHVTPAVMEKAWQKLRAERDCPKERHAFAHLSRNEADAARMRQILGTGDFYCQVEWEVAYYEQAQTLLGSVLPRLWRLGAPSDVRLVFWFDS